MNKSINHRRAEIIYRLKETEKLTIKEIALVFGVSRQSVHTWLNLPSYQEVLTEINKQNK